ncbi:MAG: 1-phosphofructokinase [Puniceicoccales bacterium]
MSKHDFITVTLNPAIDHTVFVNGLRPGSVHRSDASHRQAGGKGINVATMLALGGARVAVTGVLGDGNIDLFEEHFTQHMLSDHFVRIPGETRTGIKIVDTAQGETTDINFAGAEPTQVHQNALIQSIEGLTKPGQWVVVAGSLPQGVAPDFLTKLIHEVHRKGGLVAVDTSGKALAAAIDAKADLAKPNNDELAELFGHPLESVNQIRDAARELRQRSSTELIVSMGSQGALFLTAEGECIAQPPKAKVISTVGAGDSLLAGYLQGVQCREPLAQAARRATAYAWNRLESLEAQLPNAERLNQQMELIDVRPLTD